LSNFLAIAQRNQRATFANCKGEYELLQEIDSTFIRIGENLINPQNILSANMFYRSHSAYRAACGASIAGQAPESFVLLRSCLEYAGYGLYIFRNPEAGFKWLNRHQSDADKRAMRNEFKAINIQAVVASAERRLGEVFQELYERSIDFGGHPNVMGVSGNMSAKDEGDRVQLSHHYLHANDTGFYMALKSTAQVGATSLHIFQHVFTARFQILGVRETLAKLRTKDI
jgi:hypothetical protein